VGVKEVLRSERELARQYGVARTTVRRALRRLVADGYLVSQPRQGYEAAGETAASAGALMAFVHDSPRGPWAWSDFQMHFWNDFQRAAGEAGRYLVAVGVEGRRPAELAAQLGSLGVRGAIVDSDDPSLAEGLRKAGLPLVLVDAAFSGFCAVTQDNFAGAHRATAHLIAKGHRRIAWLGFDPKPLGSRIHFTERLGGYLAAMGDAGLEAPRDLRIAGKTAAPEEGAAALRALFEGQDVPEAAVVLWPEFLQAVGVALSGLNRTPELAVWWGCLPGARQRWRDAFSTLPVPAGVEWSFAELARMAFLKLDEQIRTGLPSAGRWLVPARLIPAE
jgi:DNA-binding LacI/PurR family transcriptional regulator